MVRLRIPELHKALAVIGLSPALYALGLLPSQVLLQGRPPRLVTPQESAAWQQTGFVPQLSSSDGWWRGGSRYPAPLNACVAMELCRGALKGGSEAVMATSVLTQGNVTQFMFHLRSTWERTFKFSLYMDVEVMNGKVGHLRLPCSLSRFMDMQKAHMAEVLSVLSEDWCGHVLNSLLDIRCDDRGFNFFVRDMEEYSASAIFPLLKLTSLVMCQQLRGLLEESATACVDFVRSFVHGIPLPYSDAGDGEDSAAAVRVGYAHDAVTAKAAAARRAKTVKLYSQRAATAASLGQGRPPLQLPHWDRELTPHTPLLNMHCRLVKSCKVAKKDGAAVPPGASVVVLNSLRLPCICVCFAFLVQL